MKINAHLMEMTGLEGTMHYFSLLLYQMVWERALLKKDFVAVELGVDFGNSTVAILAGLERAGQGHLWSYDIQACDMANDNVRTAGLEWFWTFNKMSSLDDDALGHGQVDFLFLDTDHEYENTVKELDAWAPKIVRGGRILLHDTLSRPHGVGRAVLEFVNRDENKDWSFYNIDVSCGLGVLIKL